MTAADMVIEPADELRDLEAMVRIHLVAFPGFFLSRMGPAFLRDYYGAVFGYSQHIALVARGDNSAVAFITGFHSPQHFYAAYRRRQWRMLGPVVAAAARHPSLIPLIVANARRVSAPAAAETDVELSSLAVLPDWSGRSVGSRLVRTFVERARRMGARGIFLATDAQSNESVNRFYRKHGFRLEHSYRQHDRQMYRLRLDLET